MNKLTNDFQLMVQELWDREKIKELTHSYGLAIESKDEVMMANLFTEGGKVDFSSLGWGIITGKNAIKEFYRGTWPLDVKPYFSNHIIEIEGEFARGNCALDNRATRNGVSMIGSGRLHDTYENIDGIWKFATRRVEMFFLAPITKGWAETS